MLKNSWKCAAVRFAAVGAALCTAVPALALEEISNLPLTGDGSGVMLPVMLGLLGLSAVLIIVYVVLSAKNKRR